VSEIYHGNIDNVKGIQDFSYSDKHTVSSNITS